MPVVATTVFHHLAVSVGETDSGNTVRAGLVHRVELPDNILAAVLAAVLADIPAGVPAVGCYLLHVLLPENLHLLVLLLQNLHLLAHLDSDVLGTAGLWAEGCIAGKNEAGRVGDMLDDRLLDFLGKLLGRRTDGRGSEHLDLENNLGFVENILGKASEPHELRTATEYSTVVQVRLRLQCHLPILLETYLLPFPNLLPQLEC